MQRKSTTTIEYLKQLISNYEYEKPLGYKEKVGELKATIKTIEKMNKIKEKGGTTAELDDHIKREIDELLGDKMEKKPEKGFFAKIYQKIMS